MNLREEWVRTVQGLDVPNDKQVSNLENYSAVRLFLESARHVRGDFELATERACVVSICQIVAGMPLALELAASWLKVMPCEMIITELKRNLDFLESRLANMPVRHRSMKAVFDQSWHLLSKDEQAVYKKLAVFRGGCLRDAATFVTGASLPMLSNLVDKSLLQVDVDGRYHLHSLLRQFAEEKLKDAPKDYMMASNQLCQYYTEFLRERNSDVWRTDKKQVYQDIWAELDNIRRALNWALDQRNPDELRKAIVTFTQVCYQKSLWTEGYTLYGRIIELARNIRDQGLLWQGLASQGWFAHCLSDYEHAARLYEESLTIGRQSRWQGGVQFKSFLMLRLSEMAMRQGDFERARQYIEELKGDQTSPILLRETQGRIAYLTGDYQDAKQVLLQALTLARISHNQSGIVVISNHLGYVYLAQGCIQQPVSLLQRAYHTDRHSTINVQSPGR